jgi:hypothetical protein
VEFFASEPADFSGVAGGLELSSNTAAEKIDQDIVILHALFGVAEDAVVDAEQVGGFDDESGFFAGLADGGIAHQFTDFEDASGDGPLRLQRRVGAFDQENAGLFDDYGADADQRDFGEFALHISRKCGARILQRIQGEEATGTVNDVTVWLQQSKSGADTTAF